MIRNLEFEHWWDAVLEEVTGEDLQYMATEIAKNWNLI